MLSCTPKLTPGRAVEVPNKPLYVKVIGYSHGLGSPGWPRMHKNVREIAVELAAKHPELVRRLAD